MTHNKYLALCEEASRTSHDPDTKLGAVIINAGGDVVATGSNRFDNEADITPERLQRPLKYQWIKHAEVNAIGGELREGCVLYCSAHPCKECAAAIVAAKIAKVVVKRVKDEGLIARWLESWTAADDVLSAGGTEIEYVEEQ